MDDTPQSQVKDVYSLVARRMTRVFLSVLLVTLATYAVGTGLIKKYFYYSALPPTAHKNYALQTYKDIYGNACNVAVVRLQNDALYATDSQAQYAGYGYGADVLVSQIEQAKDAQNIKGLLLEVDSPGGSPVGGELISKALKALGKPSVALIYDEGDSAAYFAATGATTIIASPFSMVGDIGVTGSFIDYSGANQKAGNTFVQISSGKYKDAGNPDKPLTAEELALLRGNVDIEYRTLVEEIAQNRNMSTTTVTELADGAAIPGSLALKRGLVDALGNLETARQWFAQKFSGKVVLCDPDQFEQ